MQSHAKTLVKEERIAAGLLSFALLHHRLDCPSSWWENQTKKLSPSFILILSTLMEVGVLSKVEEGQEETQAVSTEFTL